LIVGRRCGASEVIDAVDLELERVDHVVADQLKAGIADQVLDVGFATGEEVVEAYDFVALFDEAITEVGTEESGSAGDKNTHKKMLREKG
jgi:hypothetical protein